MTREELRTAILAALVNNDRGAPCNAQVDAVFALLPVVEHRLALLDAMNLEVTEGRGSQDEEAIWTIGPPDGIDLPGDIELLVVRPREATDG